MGIRVVITGLGMITPLGRDVEETWSGLMDAKSAVGPIRRFDAAQFPVRFAAQCSDPGPSGGTGEMVASLKGRLTRAACLEALAQSQLPGGSEWESVWVPRPRVRHWKWSLNVFEITNFLGKKKLSAWHRMRRPVGLPRFLARKDL